jgi:hypothetical protein
MRPGDKSHLPSLASELGFPGGEAGEAQMPLLHNDLEIAVGGQKFKPIEFAGLDEHAIKCLARDFMCGLSAYQQGRPIRRDTVFEMMSAVALALAPVIAGCAPEQMRARRWFDLALDQALADIAEKWQKSKEAD